MKLRLTVAVLLLTAAVVCACSSYVYLNKESRRLIDGIEEALRTDNGLLKQKALDVCGLWERCEPLFCVLIHHDDADALSRSFYLLRRQALEGSAEEVAEALSDCLANLNVLLDGEELKFTNFL